MGKKIEVFDVIPMQMRQENGVDIFRLKPALHSSAFKKRRPDAERPGVEQDRALLVAQQQRASRCRTGNWSVFRR